MTSTDPPLVLIRSITGRSYGSIIHFRRYTTCYTEKSYTMFFTEFCWLCLCGRLKHCTIFVLFSYGIWFYVSQLFRIIHYLVHKFSVSAPDVSFIWIVSNWLSRISYVIFFKIVIFISFQIILWHNISWSPQFWCLFVILRHLSWQNIVYYFDSVILCRVYLRFSSQIHSFLCLCSLFLLRNCFLLFIYVSTCVTTSVHVK